MLTAAADNRVIMWDILGTKSRVDPGTHFIDDEVRIHVFGSRPPVFFQLFTSVQGQLLVQFFCTDMAA